MERAQHGRGQAALLLGALAQVLEQGPERAGALERSGRFARVRLASSEGSYAPLPNLPQNPDARAEP
ncbi:MAG: hypothetical protein ACREJE_02590, partial [Candidatus Rokuibacteriota bacterium]